MKNKIAFLIIRVCLGAVFLMFGIGKFRNDIWVETIRGMDFFLQLPWSADITVILVGISEVLTGTGLILGLFTRFFAGLAAMQLMSILVLLKFQETRDIGLFGAALYMALAENESFGLDWWWKKRKGGVK